VTDLSAIQSELEAAEAAVAEARSVQSRLESLVRLRAATETELVSARMKLGDERQDVADLESFSPTRIWAALRGTRLDDLDREQAEVQAAEYAVAQLEARVKSLRYDEYALRTRAADLRGAAERRDRALAAKEATVVAAGGEVGAELGRIAADLGGLESESKELDEALQASVAATKALVDASQMLGKAGDWAAFDTFLGGGLLTDMAKYDRMDQANRLLRTADVALARLTKELGDLGRAGVAGPEVTDLTRAFDVWFDNIFSDWSVKNRIREAAERTLRAREMVADVHRSLAARRTELSDSVASRRGRREELLRA
jgi:hypothetical protein